MFLLFRIIDICISKRLDVTLFRNNEMKGGRGFRNRNLLTYGENYQKEERDKNETRHVLDLVLFS